MRKPHFTLTSAAVLNMMLAQNDAIEACAKLMEQWPEADKANHAELASAIRWLKLSPEEIEREAALD